MSLREAANGRSRCLTCFSCEGAGPWVTFPSPLHRAYSVRLLYTSSVNPLKLEPGDGTLEKLLPLILQRINPTVLRQSMAVGANGLLYEACWHLGVPGHIGLDAGCRLPRSWLGELCGRGVGVRCCRLGLGGSRHDDH